MLVRCVLTIALFSAFASGQNLHSRLQTYFDSQCKNQQFMGSVAIMQNGTRVFDAACGVANAEWDIPNSIGTEFRIGSITKQFTAVAILLLNQEGKLALSDPIRKFIPDLPQAWASVSVHQLLTHTAGIPNYTSQSNEAERKRLDKLGATPRQILGLVAKSPLTFTPGSKVEYSNTDYILLGMVTEKASGMSYQQFVQSHILDPLNLSHTGYDDTREILKGRASGYVRVGNQLENADPVDASVPWSAGGYYSTLDDLLSWSESLVRRRLLDANSTELMFRAYPETSFQGVHYGYAVVLGEKFGHRLEYYAGGIDGFSSVLQRYPELELSVAVLSNLDPRKTSVPAWTLADGLVETILENDSARDASGKK